MKSTNTVPPVASTTALDRAVQRVLAEIYEGVRHGYFECIVTCEVIGQERRRLILKAGKSYQFLIPQEECVRSAGQTIDSHDGSDTSAT